MVIIRALTLTVALLAIAPARAVPCGGGSFEAWLDGFKREAAASGITQRGLAALNGVSYDEKVVARDRHQGVFKQTFEQFSARMISPDRIRVGARQPNPYPRPFDPID